MASLLMAVLSLVFTATALSTLSSAAVYKVGDSAGWTTIGNVDYKLWAANKTFMIGDVIRFEYNPQFHNVMRGTHNMYKDCNVSAPLETFTTGNDSINITKHGHHFFFCGVPGHCQLGQKVDINVLRDTSTSPSPSATAIPPSVPAARVPGPAPNSAMSFKAFDSLLFSLVSSIVVSALFVSYVAA